MRVRHCGSRYVRLAVSLGGLLLVGLAILAQPSPVASEPVAAEPGMGVPSQSADTDCPRGRDERHEAVRASDGATLVLADGREVRLLGIVPPEPPAGVIAEAWLPALAAREALSSLVIGKTVELSYGRPREDRHGRLLAEVYVIEAGTALAVADLLIAQGHARAVASKGGGDCAHSQFRRRLAIEDTARASHAGLWTHAAYQPLAALSPDDILRQRSDFVLVEGTVVSAVDRGTRLYLNFGHDWRRDFTVVVPGGRRVQTPDARAALLALSGQRVRVRGWVERRNGPSIEIGTAGEIERLDDPTAAPAAAPR